MKEAEKTNNLQKSIENMFNNFKTEVELRIDKKFKDLKSTVTIFCFIFTGVFGFLFYFVNDQYNTRFEKLESSLFTPSKDIILNELRNIKTEIRVMSKIDLKHPLNSKTPLKVINPYKHRNKKQKK